MNSEENVMQQARDEEKYYDMLYNFTQSMVAANDMALDGYDMKSIARKLQRSAEAFYLLCKTDVVQAKKAGRPKKQTEPKEPEKSPDPEPLPENFIKDENGWGLCPVCRKKMLKLTSTTKLVNFPAYCKACRSDYVVSWWNVENKEIAYTRYVNNRHFIDRRDIRSKGMQGTGVGTFQHTRTSATERVAMQL